MVDKKPNSTNPILALSWKTGVAESVMIFSFCNSPVSFSFIPHWELLIENFLNYQFSNARKRSSDNHWSQKLE